MWIWKDINSKQTVENLSIKTESRHDIFYILNSTPAQLGYTLLFMLDVLEENIYYKIPVNKII